MIKVGSVLREKLEVRCWNEVGCRSIRRDPDLNTLNHGEDSKTMPTHRLFNRLMAMRKSISADMGLVERAVINSIRIVSNHRPKDIKGLNHLSQDEIKLSTVWSQLKPGL